MLAFLTCRDEVEVLGKRQVKDEIISINFHSQTSIKPPSYIVSMPKNSFAAKLVSKARVFAINFLPDKYMPQFNFCLNHSGEHSNKYKDTGFISIETEKIDCSRIKQADAFIECEVMQEVELNDYILMITKVLNYKNSNEFEVLANE